MSPCDLDQVAKSQAVRLADVFFIGPLMVYGGLRLGGLVGGTLAVLGVTTVLYNARNYLRVAEAS